MAASAAEPSAGDANDIGTDRHPRGQQARMGMSWPERLRLLPKLTSVLPRLAMSLVTAQGGGAILVAPCDHIETVLRGSGIV